MFNQTAALRPDMPWMWPHRGQTKQTSRLSGGTLECWPAMFHCLASVAVLSQQKWKTAKFSFSFLWTIFFYVTEALCVGWQQTNSLWVPMGEIQERFNAVSQLMGCDRKVGSRVFDWVVALLQLHPLSTFSTFYLDMIWYRITHLASILNFGGIHLGYWLHDKALQLRTTVQYGQKRKGQSWNCRAQRFSFANYA